MSMKFSHIKTHWTADDAYMMISFLDELKDSLWEVYGEEIIAMHRSETEQGDHKNSVNEDNKFDDEEIDF